MIEAYRTMYIRHIVGEGGRIQKKNVEKVRVRDRMSENMLDSFIHSESYSIHSFIFSLKERERVSVFALALKDKKFGTLCSLDVLSAQKNGKSIR